MEAENKFLIKEEMMYSGSLGCRGCGWSLLARHILDIFGSKTVYVVPASCFSIISGPYPMNAVKGTIVHTLFAAAAATATGVKEGLVKQGDDKTPVVVLAGDGGTFDIGLQALSGAATRNEDILYICNNNGAYMNTGIQSSTATPMGAITTTNPGKGYKAAWPKDLIQIIAAHHIPYIGTGSLVFLDDLRAKIQKAKDTKGFRLLMIDGFCPPGHKLEPEFAVDTARLAVDTNLFPLYEVENSKYKISYTPDNKVPVEECLKTQGRFSHLFKDDNSELVAKIQKMADDFWDQLIKT